ncbi:transposase family protein [Acidithiobacillus ferrooxidans]|nr:transposase family protein [Acidithiobacillus ferrooxidans]MCR1346346.1 transposase family protein [Acidithiobacillus ferrooxidans]MCR1356324.1 transposase family protein [Acidithiobacillus ferrooxidans]
MVEHCGGPKHDGNFVHSLVLTDIASGWTECIAMPVRAQSLIVAALEKVALDLPFPMVGVDTDNDSAFMNQTVFDYCKDHELKQTRSRAYKKNGLRHGWSKRMAPFPLVPDAVRVMRTAEPPSPI